MRFCNCAEPESCREAVPGYYCRGMGLLPTKKRQHEDDMKRAATKDLEGPARGALNGTEERPSQSTGITPLQRLEYALNDTGMGRGATLQSIQRFYHVNTARAMILMVLREACFGVLSADDWTLCPSHICPLCYHQFDRCSCELRSAKEGG